MRRNIDAWWPHVNSGAEAIIITASGCAAMVKEYGQLLANDSQYAEKAKTISSITKDLSEVIAGEDLTRLPLKDIETRIAVHCPCTLQHGQQLPDLVYTILSGIGFKLVKTRDKHLCCGSASTYSLLQPRLSQKLLRNKIRALSIDTPERIVTANVGCQLHLSSATEVPVQHWIEVIDEASK
jgi:glycolate oxidase iron-sulfur subunit